MLVWGLAAPAAGLDNATTSILQPLISTSCTCLTKMLPSCFSTPSRYRITSTPELRHTVFAARTTLRITWSQHDGRGCIRPRPSAFMGLIRRAVYFILVH